MTHQPAFTALVAGPLLASASMTVLRLPLGADVFDLPAPGVTCTAFRFPVVAETLEPDASRAAA